MEPTKFYTLLRKAINTKKNLQTFDQVKIADFSLNFQLKRIDDSLPILLIQRNMAGQGADEGAAAEEPWKDCLGQKEASDLDNTLFFEYEYSIDQLMEIAGLCVAQVSVLLELYNSLNTVLLVCTSLNLHVFYFSFFLPAPFYFNQDTLEVLTPC